MILNIIPLKFSNDSLLKKLIFRLSVLFYDIKVAYALIDIEKSYSDLRKQYHSTVILESIIKSNPDMDGHVLILTEMDLFVPVLTHVFGEAQLNGKYSIVSVCRLYEEFYTSESDSRLILDRSYKEILHELGHNFGLVHCKDWECVMHVSNSVEEIDIKGNYYCVSCQKKIRRK
jgi:archaemetzincin